MTGEQILEYRIEKLLGEGGMGAVYLATHTQLDRQVAIKVLNPYLLRDTTIRERFNNEAAAMTSLQHANIVSLYDYLETGGNLCLVMEYIEGDSVEQYLRDKNGPIPEGKAIQLFVQILDAFAYAHSKGIIHRDIKPANVMISRDGQPKILDFGIARIVDEVSGKFTTAGIRTGTVVYMSPEQVHGRQADIRSDIYSLGVLFFEMLTGKPPYNREVHSDFDIQTMIVNKLLPRVKAVNPAVSQRLQVIIDKATAKNPDERFQNCEAFKKSIMAEEEQQQELALAQLMHEVAEKGHEQKASENISTIEAAKIRSRNRKIQLTFSVVALLVAAYFIVRMSMLDTSGWSWSALFPSTTEQVNSADADTPDKANVPLAAPANTAKKNATSAGIIKRPSDRSAYLPSSASGRGAALTKKDFQTYLTGYYTTLQAKNLNQLQQYYAPPLTRFFSEYGVSSERLGELLQHSWQGTPENRYEIQWDTFRFYQDEKENYIMDFYMNYQFRRTGNGDWRQQKLYTMMKMNKDLKIFYITGD